MRCYRVEVLNRDQVSTATRLASTNADARVVREELMAEFSVKKKDVSIEPHEVPLAKAELLVYLNDLYKQTDTKPDEGV